MIDNEKDLANAIMRGDYTIELDAALEAGVSKIKYPSEVVWRSVAAALITSAFFWGGATAIGLLAVVGLSAALAVCGGVGGVVFVAPGAKGTLCAFKLLSNANTMDVLTKLRDDYEQNDCVLTKK